MELKLFSTLFSTTYKKIKRFEKKDYKFIVNFRIVKIMVRINIVRSKSRVYIIFSFVK